MQNILLSRPACVLLVFIASQVWAEAPRIQVRGGWSETGEPPKRRYPDRRAPRIRVRGGWSETIDASDLKQGPGSQLRGKYQSIASACQIFVWVWGFWNYPGKPNTWRVDVRKLDVTWHTSFSLYVRRTSDGVGTGSISGGTNYQKVTNTDQSFFTGSNNRYRINVQCKLTGVSLSIPPGEYTTTLVFTVVDT